MDVIGWVALGKDGRLRAGWRVLGHIFLLMVSIVVLGLGGSVVVGLLLTLFGDGPQLSRPFSMAVSHVLSWAVCMPPLVVSVLLLNARYKGGFRLGRLRGVGQGGPALRSLGEIGLGLVLGPFGVAIAVAIMALGGMSVQLSTPSVASVATSAMVAIILVFAAWFEELLFRGYLFQWLGGAIARVFQAACRAMGLGRVGGQIASFMGFYIPILLSSVLFGMLHLSNPGATDLSTVNTVLAGVWFSVLVLRQGSLWSAISAHWAWNATILLGVGLPVSGLGPETGLHVVSLIDLEASGPEWLSGGLYGPEGSIGATVALVVLTAVSAILPRRKKKHGLVAVYEVQGVTGAGT
ncbi:MAG: lysostaphin resistance A-like protein [Myxococcota bacterium]